MFDDNFLALPIPLDVKPTSSWSVDPFGHSPTMAYLLKGAGIDKMVIQRVHYAIKRHLAQSQKLEFIWRQSWGIYAFLLNMNTISFFVLQRFHSAFFLRFKDFYFHSTVFIICSVKYLYGFVLCTNKFLSKYLHSFANWAVYMANILENSSHLTMLTQMSMDHQTYCVTWCLFWLMLYYTLAGLTHIYAASLTSTKTNVFEVQRLSKVNQSLTTTSRNCEFQPWVSDILYNSNHKWTSLLFSIKGL